MRDKIGGNLKSLMNLLNTEYMPDVTDKVLFLEAYASSTPLELVDCYLSVLKYHKIFDKIKFIIELLSFAFFFAISIAF